VGEHALTATQTGTGTGTEIETGEYRKKWVSNGLVFKEDKDSRDKKLKNTPIQIAE